MISDDQEIKPLPTTGWREGPPKPWPEDPEVARLCVRNHRGAKRGDVGVKTMSGDFEFWNVVLPGFDCKTWITEEGPPDFVVLRASDLSGVRIVGQTITTLVMVYEEGRFVSPLAYTVLSVLDMILAGKAKPHFKESVVEEIMKSTEPKLDRKQPNGQTL